MRNIGTVSREWLAEIEVYTVDDLKRVGGAALPGIDPFVLADRPGNPGSAAAENLRRKNHPALGQILEEEFPNMKGFSPRNLKQMRSLSETYPEDYTNIMLFNDFGGFRWLRHYFLPIISFSKFYRLVISLAH